MIADVWPRRPLSSLTAWNFLTALLGEMAVMLWRMVKGAEPQPSGDPASAPAAGQPAWLALGPV